MHSEERSQDTSGVNCGSLPPAVQASLNAVALIGYVNNPGTLNLRGNTLKGWIHLPPGKVLHPLYPAVAARRQLTQKANSRPREDKRWVESKGKTFV